MLQVNLEREKKVQSQSRGSFVLLVLLFSLIILSCSAGQENALVQDTSVLSDSNGLIVEQQLLRQPDESTEIHKIRYVSDGLEVVGFVVKPVEVQGKLPVLIFNRGGNRAFGKIDEKLFGYLAFLASRGYVVVA